MKVITGGKVPIKAWLTEIEDGAARQAENLSNLPFVYSHVALMPDCHEGYGMPIGGVLATEGVVIPNAVGVDIGCGMSAVKTSLASLSKDDLHLITQLIKEVIPVGFKRHNKTQDDSLMPEGAFENLITEKEYDSALHQLGTLGGGNHFIEIQAGSDDHVWVMVHSGSRNLGKKVADHYNELAKLLNRTWHSSVNPAHDLAFLPSGSEEASQYMEEMNYCVDFAFANRKLMMQRIMEIFDKVVSGVTFPAFRGDTIINIAHNYARIENHFGRNVLVHRKGATSARFGEIGIIPGSQGTYSYIVGGLGNRQSFESCSHGAGRVMGRAQAKRELSLDYEVSRMNSLGILHDMKTVDDLDESASAYKDIDTVMLNQADLVTPLVKLRPLAVIKG